MMEAYFDESGTHAGSPVMCVSGYLLNARNSNAVYRAIKTKLAELRRKYPRIEFFHMKELAPGGGQFKGVPDKERQQIGRWLVELINARKTYGITVAVSEADYAATMPPEWIQQYGQAYTTCVRLCVHHLGAWADKQKYYGHIAYFFESGATHEAEADGLLRGMGADPEMKRKIRYGSHTFADKRIVLPLQLADVGAWEFTKLEVDTRINRKRPARASMRSLGRERGTDSAYQLEMLTVQRLEQLRDQNPVRRFNV
jgi:hypothetical protein